MIFCHLISTSSGPLTMEGSDKVHRRLRELGYRSIHIWCSNGRYLVCP